MNSAEIYNLAGKMTEQEALNVVETWKSKINSDIMSEKKEAIEKIEKYNRLVNLGDSIQLACATVIFLKPIDNQTLEFYRFAYEN